MIRTLDKRNKTVFLRVETLTYIIHRDAALKIVEMYTMCCDDDDKAVHLRIKYPKVVDTGNKCFFGPRVCARSSD